MTRMPPRVPVTAYVALGANLGDAAAAVRQALQALGTLPATQCTRCSSLYRTAPVDAGGPDFINAVAEVSTGLSAPELLRALQALEQDAGRERPYRHAPRTLDLDLLLYGDGRIDSPALTLPHPRMGQRAFVMVPLAEIAPHWRAAARDPALAGQRIERL
ncbi:2-amino-4-hydroxy-6-hydroxymethyldihydropteridine diphosphokinase [Variovorax terrae]|uniref:2-amino-4-hydroxy-6-hydroxymethyldihydropteridine pyrophosphokinase n=1 Tax=Variovorax terrae TaxID=2923278 RepID=A0A9X2ANA4_9BURK|nr:2-amino-4-hydroxy-6-hydroxymethyldihydropteridine diphosphokinase [Variovorax terrae]MCJ0764194.1 2-amino-4-hydroxy-6-hydroxymethyldihydropteridine diphosphokinase [Variovorax terrae]